MIALQLVDAEEQQTCIYTLTFRTPAACDAQFLQAKGLDVDLASAQSPTMRRLRQLVSGVMHPESGVVSPRATQERTETVREADRLLQELLQPPPQPPSGAPQGAESGAGTGGDTAQRKLELEVVKYCVKHMHKVLQRGETHVEKERMRLRGMLDKPSVIEKKKESFRWRLRILAYFK